MGKKIRSRNKCVLIFGHKNITFLPAWLDTLFLSVKLSEIVITFWFW